MTVSNRIDAHVHLWSAARDEDILILSQMPDLTPAGEAGPLASYLDDEKIDLAIAVQSAPSWAHSQWLCDTAGAFERIGGVVAWIDPLASDWAGQVDHLTADPIVCGIRLMLNRLAEPDSVLRPEALECLSALAAADITIECLAPPHCIPIAAAIARALPEARIVLDHCGLPPGPEGDMDLWAGNISTIARLPNVTTKFSGLIEPFGSKATLADVENRALQVLDLFGPERLMASSNFPVCDLGGGAGKWSDMLAELLNRSALSDGEKQMIHAGTAHATFPRISTRCF